MCELLAMSARFPTTVRLSFEELARHGGGTGPHADGWGLGLWQDGDALVVREPDAASRSRWVQFIQEREPRTSIAIAHIRRATQGARLLRNTQPFARELGGRMHLFAHNGMLHGIEHDTRFPTLRYLRIGDTDSEQAFCALLERLAPLWASGPPPLADRLRAIGAFASALRSLGPANFLYTDGDAIFAHGHRRMHDRGEIRPPGLHILCRSCAAASDTLDISGLAIDPQEKQQVALVASVPLSREHWEPLAEGEIVVLRDGRVTDRVNP
jgi:glutamine amidotransferase